MSQVLIGIIGVILFIGLALAGAMFLGPQFQNSTNNSRASAMVQATSQIAAAYEMYRVQTGVNAALADLTDDGYLKTLPVNPTDGGNATLALVGAVNLVRMPVGDDSAAGICTAINRQSSGDDSILPITVFDGPSPSAPPSGCYVDGTTNYAYTRV